MQRSPFLLESAGVALAFAWTADDEPIVTYWGAAPVGSREEFADALAASMTPSVMHSSFDHPRVIGALPSQQQGWSGASALALHRGRRALFPRFSVTSVERASESVVFSLDDGTNGTAVDLAYRIDSSGCIHASVAIRNVGPEPLDVQAVRLLLPLPVRADELLDLTGRWTGERRPQRRVLLDGAHVRASRRGRTGHDAPLLEMVGTRGFAFRRGEIWATHVAWSGDAEHRVERLSEGFGVLNAVLGGGELLSPGEIVLEPGHTYRSPEVVFVWSDAGIDGLADRLHNSVRALPSYPSTPRPLTLNTWEAVYFDQSFDRLAALAELAKDVGVERFVLDDGWFQRRRDDTIGLGDWFVDKTVWPDGLEPLASRVRELGMEFGLWFEPEMVNLGSKVASMHPEWILGPEEDLAPTWRNQYALNLADPAAFEYLLSSISALVGRLDIRFIKWDHNRDLHEAIDRRTGVSAVHEQTAAFYRLIDALRARHPRLEIEACASGGARVDLGVMAHAQRVWASDTNDAIERQRIQEWTSVLLPPELIGSHVGPPRSHTSGRVLDLSFRLVTALFAHAGIEWDISGCSPEELDVLRQWAALYRSVRELIATGQVVRSDDLAEGSSLYGVVSADAATALFAWAQTTVGPMATSPRVPIPGLDPSRRYRVEVLENLGAAERRSIADPSWMRSHNLLELPGDLLGRDGIPLPVLHPGQAVLVRCTQVDSEPVTPQPAHGN